MPKKEEWMRVGDWKLKLSNLEKNRSPKRKGKATLIWLANLVSLELHQMHVCQSDFDQPGYMVFDLGPADNSDCQRVDQAGNRWMNFTDPCHENTYMEINTSGGVKNRGAIYQNQTIINISCQIRSISHLSPIKILHNSNVTFKSHHYA